jgi:hypothetical protein
MRTELCDMFGIDVPIFAFSHCRDVVAAVTNAGGLGVLGALAFSPEQLEIELSWIDAHVDGKPYGVDIVMPASYEGKDRGLGKTDEAGAVDATVFEDLIPQAQKDFIEKVLEEYKVPPLPEGMESGFGGPSAGPTAADETRWTSHCATRSSCSSTRWARRPRTSLTLPTNTASRWRR